MDSTLDIRAPAEQTEGTRSQVLRWLKKIGESVSEHEPLIEIETDKVTVEVASPASGVLREIVKGEQEEIAPGEVLGRLELDADTNFGGRANPASGLALSDAADAGSAASNGAVAVPNHVVSERGSSEPTAVAARLSPAVRRLLAERGIDAASIRGSGEGGRITVDDVIAHASGALATSTAPARVAASPPSQAPATAAAPSPASHDAGLPSHSVPHTAIRKRIAEHMVQSLLQTAPHVTTLFEVDLSAVMAHRAQHRADFEHRGAPLTLTAYFVLAAVEAIRAVPEANSRWADNALEIYDTINIGIATALEAGGLVVPVLHKVESRTLFDVASGLNDLVKAAREGRLKPADVRGGTFTISNHGVSGSLLATPIVINQPQSAILGVGKLEKRPVVITEQGEDRVVVRPKCYVTLTIDHRVMDGHQANRFLQQFVRTLEAWREP
jgi:2-oxoglutarate dehydrogenase E2 component (dihydrolipoamide succinyltransferase)